MKNKNKPNHNQFVRCLENIQDLSGMGHYDYVISLAGGICGSYKTISYNPKTKKYKIINHVDSSKQYLTKQQILNNEYTNIKEAMEKRCLIALID